MNAVKKSVYQIVGNPVCVEADDGMKVYAVLKEFLDHNQTVSLSFLNVEMLTSAFLNTAIGLLYKDYPEEMIKRYIKLEDMQPTDAELLKRVVNTAKLYYKDPEFMKKSVKAILGEE
jgi:hypothetical protein